MLANGTKKVFLNLKCSLLHGLGVMLSFTDPGDTYFL